jgi:hypothetical protein
MFDTLKYSKILEAVGVARDQAEAHIKIISEIVEGDLATKQDIERLENKLVQLEYRLIIKLSATVGAIVTLAIAITAALTKLI